MTRTNAFDGRLIAVLVTTAALIISAGWTAVAQSSPQPWPSSELDDAQALTSANGQFVAVGRSGDFPGSAAAWVSTDGLAWQPATVTPEQTGTVMDAVVATDAGYLGLGTEISTDAGGPDRIAAWRSTDGMTWERATVKKPANKGLGAGVRSLADGPAGTLALAVFFGQDLGPSRLYLTADGATWAPTPLPDAKDIVWSNVVSIPDGYLLLGTTFQGRPSVWQSADGQAWDQVKDAPRIYDAAANADGLIVGIGDKEIWTTQDLSSWESVWQTADPDASDGQPALEWVEWDGSQFATSQISFVGCAENIDECNQHTLLLSPDGIDWTAAAGPDGQPGSDQATFMTHIASNGSATVVMGISGPSPTLAWLVDLSAGVGSEVP